jgi:hypothetical protein
MAKMIAFNEEARRGLERGMNVLADAVKVTLRLWGFSRHHARALRSAPASRRRAA